MSNTKKVLPPFKVVSAGSLSSNLTSPATNIQYLDNIAIQINILTGSPSGTFSVQGSVDYNPGGFKNDESPMNGNWITLTSAAATVSAGTPSNILFNLDGLTFPYIRVFYASTGGSGTADYFISGKSF